MADGNIALKGADRTRLAYLDEHLQREIDRSLFPGVVTQIWRGGTQVHGNALGFRDMERQAPMTADTLCRLYSMTKPIASVALMQLYERGLVRLDDPVHDYIPEWRDLQVRSREDRSLGPCARAMTVRDVLTHQSGLGTGHQPKPASGDRPAIPPAKTTAEAMSRLAKHPLMFQPGAEYDYGVSTDVVGRLVEIISGQDLGAYLQQAIFEPLGMTETGFSVPKADAGRLAALYEKTASGGLKLRDDPERSPLTGEITYQSGAGGLVGTTNDYVRFGRMLLGGGQLDGQRILGRKTLELMAMNHLTGGRDIASATRADFFKVFTGQGFGLGFGVLLDPAAAQLSGSVGEFYWTGAAGSICFVDPAEDLMVVFMTQAIPTLPVADPRNPYGWREIRAIIYGALD